MVMANRQIIDPQKRQQLELRNDDWNALETTCDLLEPFAVLTKFFEGQSYVSLSAVQPLIKGIILAMRVNATDAQFAVNFKREATKQLESRFANLFSVQAPLGDRTGFAPAAVKATAVDTRFHKLKSLISGHPRIVRTLLEKELVVFGQRQHNQQEPANNNSAITADDPANSG
jgi:hypothetical protein